MRATFIHTVLLFLMLLSTGIHVSAQHLPLFSQYMFNPVVINPAYAGSQESLSLSSYCRKQWTNVEGAPSTLTLSAHSPLKNRKVALGLILTNDQFGVNNQNIINAIYAYRIRLSEKSVLSFGLQANAGRFTSDFSSLDTRDPNDPTFSQSIRSAYLLNFGAGIYYNRPKFFAGFSMPYILNNGITSDMSNTVTGINRHYFFSTGVVIDISDDLKYKPFLLFRASNNMDSQIDLNNMILFRDVLWLGVSYRSFSSINYIARVLINDQLTIGYGYDQMIGKLRPGIGGSHEFLITYNFRFMGSNIRSPRYF
ncbi:MAG: type IX secretion system membrane protein PorP/SprF [Cytophagaceae bacterium]